MGKDEIVRGSLKGDLFQAHASVERVVTKLDAMWVDGSARFRPEELKHLREYALKIDQLLFPLLQILDDFERIAGHKRNPHVEKVKDVLRAKPELVVNQEENGG